MRFDTMRPPEIRKAIAEGRPVVLALGVLEYHGEHLPVGMDTLVVQRILERLEAEREIILLPPFPYGAASYAVAPPEGTGSVQVDGMVLAGFAEQLFLSLLRIGFRNIHAVIHHQTENFAQGMPTDLAFRLGARQAVFRLLEQTRGEGWWGKADGADYYAGHARGENPFNWVQVHPLMSPEIMAAFHFDHAGLGETSLMCALCPETVEMTALAEAHPWYVAGAEQATAAEGERGVSLILDRLRTLIT